VYSSSIIFYFSDGKRHKIVPIVKRVNANQTAVLSCVCCHDTRWFFNGLDLPEEVVAHEHNTYLQIHRTSAKHSGFYQCIGLNRNNKTFLIITELKVYCEWNQSSDYIFHECAL